jgi:hypothetical protein
MTALNRLLTWFHTAPGQPRVEAGRQVPWRQVFRVALLGLLLGFLFVGDRVGIPDDRFDPSAPFVVGTERGLDQELRARGVELADELSVYGYDGQWFLFQASDPWLREGLVRRFDAPQYRGLRMLYPAGGWLLAAGQPPATPYTLLVVGVFAVALGCAGCARIASAYGRSPWWGGLFIAIPGVQVGLGYGTAEPLGLALAVLGISLVLDRRYLLAGFAFAGAALTKESYLAFGVITAVYLAVDRSRASRGAASRWLPPAAAVALPGLVGLFAWWAYVRSMLPAEDDPHGNLGRFSVPGSGWWEVLGTIVRGDYPAYDPFGVPSEAVMVASFAVTISAVVLAVWLRQSPLAYLTLAWGGYGLMIAGFLLERDGSAYRALAPTVLTAALFLVTIRLPRPSPKGDAPTARTTSTVDDTPAATEQAA